MCVHQIDISVFVCVKKCRASRGGGLREDECKERKAGRRGRLGGAGVVDDAVALAMVVTSRAVWLSLATRHDVRLG